MKQAVLLTLAGGLLVSSVLHAELNKQDRKQVESMLSGTLYARIDIPCGTGRHPVGTYMYPLVEVSPDVPLSSEPQATRPVPRQPASRSAVIARRVIAAPKRTRGRRV